MENIVRFSVEDNKIYKLSQCMNTSGVHVCKMCGVIKNDTDRDIHKNEVN